MGRDMREIMEPAWSLQGPGAKLEILSGPLAGVYDPRGISKMFFALLAGFAELERGMMTERTNDGLARAAARSGRSPAVPSATPSAPTTPDRPPGPHSRTQPNGCPSRLQDLLIVAFGLTLAGPPSAPHRDAHDGSTTDSYSGAGDTDPSGGPSRPTRE
jgi:hypothetical protein